MELILSRTLIKKTNCSRELTFLVLKNDSLPPNPHLLVKFSFGQMPNDGEMHKAKVK